MHCITNMSSGVDKIYSVQKQTNETIHFSLETNKEAHMLHIHKAQMLHIRFRFIIQILKSKVKVTLYTTTTTLTTTLTTTPTTTPANTTDS